MSYRQVSTTDACANGRTDAYHYFIPWSKNIFIRHIVFHSRIGVIMYCVHPGMENIWVGFRLTLFNHPKCFFHIQMNAVKYRFKSYIYNPKYSSHILTKIFRRMYHGLLNGCFNSHKASFVCPGPNILKMKNGNSHK